MIFHESFHCINPTKCHFQRYAVACVETGRHSKLYNIEYTDIAHSNFLHNFKGDSQTAKRHLFSWAALAKCVQESHPHYMDEIETVNSNVIFRFSGILSVLPGLWVAHIMYGIENKKFIHKLPAVLIRGRHSTHRLFLGEDLWNCCGGNLLSSASLQLVLAET